MQAIISHTNRYIYYYTPKVACTTIRKMLAQFEGIPWYHPWDHRKVRFNYINTEASYVISYFKFAFVRNPWDRLVSCYFDKVVGVRTKPDNVAIKDGVFRCFIPYNRDFKTMEFPEFAEFVCGLSDNESNGHFRSQHTFFNHNAMDFIGRFENLTGDLEELRNKMGIKNIKEEHLMSSKHKNYKDYYNKELIDMVGNRFQKDIKLFGYEF